MQRRRFRFRFRQGGVADGRCVAEKLPFIPDFAVCRAAGMMAESVKSPLGAFDVFNFVPQGHEKALKQAFYNTVAMVFVVVATVAAVAVYFVLEPFLQPLLWAVLFGSVLHPFKRGIAQVLRGWLRDIHRTGTLFAVGVVTLPVHVVDRISESLEHVFLTYKKVMLAVLALVSSILLIAYCTPENVVRYCLCVGSVLSHVTSFGFCFFASASLLVWSAAFAFLLAVCFCWSNTTVSFFLTCLSPLMWIAIVCQLTAIGGTTTVVALVAVIVLAVMGWIKGMGSAETLQQKEKEVHSPLQGMWKWVSSCLDSPDDHRSLAEPVEVGHNLDGQYGHATQKVQVEPSTPERRGFKPPTSLGSSKRNYCKQSKSVAKMSNVYLYSLVWACILAELWQHARVLHLLFVPLVFIVTKKLATNLGLKDFLVDKVGWIWDSCGSWCNSRKDALFPPPLIKTCRFIVLGDKKVVEMLENSIDTFTSIVVMLGVLLFAIFAAIFLAVQIYGESMHLVEVTGNVINQTVVNNPEIQQLLPDGFKSMQGTLDFMLGNAYMYGREWLSGQVRRLLDENDPVRAAAVEKQILIVWDRVYHLWLARNESGTSAMRIGQADDQQGVTDTWDNILTGLKTLNITKMFAIMKENLGTLLSIFDSVWIVLKGNISLVLTAITAIISLVFGGGTALLNFVLNFIVFFTALFYLLCASDEIYKPIELVSKLLPSVSSGTKLGKAVEEAVNGVFAASFKMAAFYGLYTWLIHTLFDVQIIYIPSVLAAVFGAVPFLGAYWACLPAVLELWLVHGQLGKAIFMLFCQLIPTSFVDTAVYSEIKGGAHPYLTGLAIAGGVFCLGFEGAIFGPMLLCSLFVVFNVYSSVMEESTSSTDAKQPPGRMPLKRMHTIGGEKQFPSL